MPRRQPAALATAAQLENDPLWYKDAIIYEVHVRAFYDSVDDGMGDFIGLAQKLDYLQDLGVTTIWLLPFFPSPWRDDGYDIADYTLVHPSYGTLRDFQEFLREAHARDLRVITEVVINHTSDQHPWFQRARRSPPGSNFRDYYVWSDTPDRYREARIIFKDFETSNWSWDPVANAYYWHRFYSHQPDLNFDNPSVQQAVLDVVDYWFDMGVDGFRLDAIPYLYEREGTNCENLPETHEFLKRIRAHVDRKYGNRMLLAEANQWPDDSVAYFGRGDECHAAFHFPVMPRLFMAIRMEDRYPIIDILDQTPPIPDNCQWAMFLRNHDELTLEMVTDEERDYMYRVYAQDRQARINLGIRRRLAPLLGNDRRRIELMNILLFSMPGTPVIYYGDEIGMGDNIYLGDRNGVRTPMQWSSDRNAGFSRSNPQKLYLPIVSDPEYHYETINVEAQQNNPNSLLWWTKRAIEHRKEYQAFGRGSIEFLHPENRKVLAFYRRYEQENLLVVVNLSRFPQFVELDLSAARGLTPIEIFGRTEFPPITDQPYMLSLGAHGYYWFALERRRPRLESIVSGNGNRQLPVVQIASFDRLVEKRTTAALTKLLPDFLLTRRWFRGKARTLRDVEVIDTVQMTASTYIALVQVDYTDGDPETYVLAVAVVSGDAAARVLAEHADTAVARLRSSDGQEGVLYGAVWSREFQDALLDVVRRRRTVRGNNGELTGTPTRAFSRLAGTEPLDPSVSRAEQSNSSIIYGDRLILKLYRKLEPGLNPDIEISAMLTERGFEFTPPVAGWFEYTPKRGEPMALAAIFGYARNEGDAWKYTIDQLGPFYESVRARAESEKRAPDVSHHPLLLKNESIPQTAQELIGAYIESARLLGDRTARMHIALSDPSAGPDFVPEPFTDHYRVGLYHGMIQQANRNLQLLRKRLPNLPDVVQADARRVLELEGEIKDRFRPLRDQRIGGVRTRHHGDYHLGQVLYTGRDFVIIDFEGEPQRPLSERRLKRSPLRDVAGMLRSFQYAAWVTLPPNVRPQSMPALESWATCWTAWVSAACLSGYFTTAGDAPFLPREPAHVRILLDAFLLEKAIYEIGYELNNRPDWVRIPLRGVLSLLI